MGGKWISGENEELRWQIKRFDVGSQFGINNGRISVLWIQRKSNMETVANYDRGWDIEPKSDANVLYNDIIEKYN